MVGGYFDYSPFSPDGFPFHLFPYINVKSDLLNSLRKGC